MSQKKSEQREAVAFFKFQLFAQVLYEKRSVQWAWFEKAAKQEYQVPGKRKPTQFSAYTIRNWLRSYLSGGIQTLYPKSRSDKGGSRRITEDIKLQIKDTLEEYPSLSATGIYLKLIKNGADPNAFAESTLRRYIKENKLRIPIVKSKLRKKFECAVANLLWMIDFMHGYNIPDVDDNNRKKKTFLCAILDDHSRLIVSAQFHFQENSTALMKTLKAAIHKYGIPERLYCDNGAAFSSKYLIQVCARLGISLIHSKPYDSPSRGKSERFFRTVRTSFLAATNIRDFKSLESFNCEFNRWLQEEYLEKVHSSTHQRPKERYFNSLNHIKVSRKSFEQIEEAFLMTCYRKVHRNCTVKYKSQEFEVPAEYVGQTVEIRYPVDDLFDLRLYGSELNFVKKIFIVDPIGNSCLPALRVRFNNQNREVQK